MSTALVPRRIPKPNFHGVGDSTMTPIVQRNSTDGLYTAGHGSAESGKGYTVDAPNGTITLTPPGQPFVIAQLSVWDYDSSDLTGYSDAHAYYQTFGITPIWVELPTSSAVGEIPAITDPSVFNAAVAAELGVTLIPYAIRLVATLDGLHPTVQGAIDMVDRYTNLTGTLVSRLRGQNISTLRGVDPIDTFEMVIAAVLADSGKVGLVRPTAVALIGSTR